ncbi:MAG TPA: SoxR reducing system RseC family protein [Bacteroidales bacterium]|nr:SoxR reducing system RseC family protein [Bacteroidales bacterium]
MEASVCKEQMGTVEGISGHMIQVRIHREALCGHCSAQSLCFLGETKERIIDISDFSSDIKPGDVVDVNISTGQGNKAILLGYLVPFAVLITTLLIFSSIGAKDWIAGLSALLSLVPYYMILYLFRNRLKKVFIFSARKKVL